VTQSVLSIADLHLSYNDIEKAIKNGDYETAKAGGSTDKAKEARESKEKR
jgi:hypothetical protein